MTGDPPVSASDGNAKAFGEHSKVLKTWLVAYGIGAPVLFMTNPDLATPTNRANSTSALCHRGFARIRRRRLAMRHVRWLALVLLVCGACARVPKEAVQLSDAIGKDLAAMHTAHTALVRQYFGAMRENINAFVDYTYRPFIITFTIEDTELIGQLQDAAAGSHELGLDPLDIMEIYVEETIKRIEGFRAEMVAPINTQERTLLGELDRSYTAMMNANATITAHLRSVTKVHEAQQEALASLGVAADLRETISAQVAKLSGEVNDLLAKARQGEEGLEDLPGKIKDITKKND